MVKKLRNQGIGEIMYVDLVITMNWQDDIEEVTVDQEQNLPSTEPTKEAANVINRYAVISLKFKFKDSFLH